MTLPNLEPVDRVDVTTLVDTTADMLLPDVGPVRRWGRSGTGGPLPVAPSGVAAGGSTLDFLRAEHGYSALVDVYQGGRMHRVLYDADVSPFGLVENLEQTLSSCSIDQEAPGRTRVPPLLLAGVESLPFFRGAAGWLAACLGGAVEQVRAGTARLRRRADIAARVARCISQAKA